MSTDKYTVRQNTCGCHPQTCCCDDWAIFTETGEKFLTLDSKLLADVMAENYNLRSRETELESQVEALKQAARYETDVAAQAIADFNAMKLEVEALQGRLNDAK